MFSFNKMDDIQAGHANTCTSHRKAQGRKKREAQASISPVISKSLFMLVMILVSFDWLMRNENNRFGSGPAQATSATIWNQCVLALGCIASG